VARKIDNDNHRLAQALESPPNPGEDFLSGAEWLTLADSARLTTREMVVAILLIKGRTRKGIGLRLKVSAETVRVHVKALFKKFHVRDRLALGLRIARLREAIKSGAPADLGTRTRP
jgi:DNA-binding NarL/FixJ family response regulator